MADLPASLPADTGLAQPSREESDTTTHSASAPQTESPSAPADDAAPSLSPKVFTLKRPRATEPVTRFLSPTPNEASPASTALPIPPKQPRTDTAGTPVTPRSPYADLPRKIPRKTPVSTPTSSLGTPAASTPALVSPSSNSPTAAPPAVTTPPQPPHPAVTTAASRRAALHQRWAAMLHDVLMKEREPNETEFVMALSLRIVEALPGNLEETKDGFQAILFGMKDVKNVELRRRVVEGDLLVEKLVRMDERELANPELRKKIEDTMEERAKNTNMSELAKAMRTSNSTLFKCHVCGARDTSWFQRQTRSGDEPMTVIITCNRCNTQWRKY